MSRASSQQANNGGNGTIAAGYEEEHVIAVPDNAHPNWFVPKVTSTKKSGLTVTRDFEALIGELEGDDKV